MKNGMKSEGVEWKRNGWNENEKECDGRGKQRGTKRRWTKRSESWRGEQNRPNCGAITKFLSKLEMLSLQRFAVPMLLLLFPAFVSLCRNKLKQFHKSFRRIMMISAHAHKIIHRYTHREKHTRRMSCVKAFRMNQPWFIRQCFPPAPLLLHTHGHMLLSFICIRFIHLDAFSYSSLWSRLPKHHFPRKNSNSWAFTLCLYS